ncbi:unnamed protein product, partial [Ectocarpus fasciculatus]
PGSRSTARTVQRPGSRDQLSRARDQAGDAGPQRRAGCLADIRKSAKARDGRSEPGCQPQRQRRGPAEDGADQHSEDVQECPSAAIEQPQGPEGPQRDVRWQPVVNPGARAAACLPAARHFALEAFCRKRKREIISRRGRGGQRRSPPRGRVGGGGGGRGLAASSTRAGDVISRSGTRGFGGYAADSGAGATAAAAAAAVYADAAGIWESGVSRIEIFGRSRGGGAHRRAGVDLQQARDNASGPARNG